MPAVTYGLTWKPGDEVLTASGEFPLQYATWKPMEEREGVKLNVISPRDRFLTSDDFIAALTPRTRLVSVSLVRFDDGVLLDAARLSAACHAQGALLLLDVSQCCGAVPMDVNQLGADCMISAGYKWLLGPFGTGFSGRNLAHLQNAPGTVLLDGGGRGTAALAFAIQNLRAAAAGTPLKRKLHNLAALDAG
jgi:selenocysteine lyase/cysteine desulfurase